MELDKDTLKKELTDVIKAESSDYIKAQLKEHLDTAIAEVKKSFAAPDPAIEQAKKDALKFKSFGEQASAIWKFRNSGGRDRDNRLAYLDQHGQLQNLDNVKALVEGTDSTGGFLVFPQYDADIKYVALEQSIIRPNGPTIIPMKSDTLLIPRIDETSHASTVYGGFVGYWTGEGATMTEANPKWGNCQLSAHKLAFWTRASNELLADNAVGLEAFLRPRVAETLAWFEDIAFVQGAGGGQPLGILNAPCLISVTRKNTSHVVPMDILKMYTEVLPASRDKIVWLLNHEVLMDLLTSTVEPYPMTYATTPAYSATPWFQANLVDPVKKTILGRPYFVSEKMSGLGDAGDIGCFDLSYYLIGERQPLTIDASTHVYFTSDYTAWRFVERIDGQPWLQSALTPYKGSDTLSPFVSLSAAS